MCPLLTVVLQAAQLTDCIDMLALENLQEWDTNTSYLWIIMTLFIEVASSYVTQHDKIELEYTQNLTTFLDFKFHQ